MIYCLLLSFTVTFLWQLLHFYLKGNDHGSLAWAMQAWGSPTHEIYRYLTHGWMHSTTYPWHLFLNLLGVLYLGRDLEKRFSSLKILAVFFLGILLGALFWRLLPSYGDYPKWRLIGCSAGVCAWFAWELLEIIRSGKKGEGIGPEWLLVGTVLFELICWKMGWLGFIAHSAHLGGLLAGSLAFIGLRREEVLKKIAFYIKPLLIDSDMKSLFSNRNKMIAISVINLLIVLYLGSIVWSLKNPTKKLISKTEKPTVSVESLVTQILAPLSTKERLEKVLQIPSRATLDQIKPLSVAWNIDWSGYQKSSELEKAQWLAQINGLYLKKEGGKVPMARAMASLLSTPNLPIIIRNRAYLDLCNAWVGADQQLQQATSDPKLATSLPEREKELKELTIIVKVVTLALDRQGDLPLLPLRIQAKTYFTVHRPQEFNSKEWEAELIALQKKFPGDERIQIEIFKGLQALSSNQGIDRALQILNSTASSEALIKMAMSYLSNPPSPRGKEGLTKKRFIYPDLEEERLKYLEMLN